MFLLKKYLSLIVLFVLGIVGGVGGTLLFQHFNGPKQTVNITGLGVVEAPADQATISLTIQNTSWSQDQAEKDNKEEVQKLKDKLITLGIPESRITQSSYNTIPMPMIPDQTLPQPLIGQDLPVKIQYPPSTTSLTASTSLYITLDTLQGIDKVLTAINESPNAKITSTNYSLKSTAPYESQAREKAVQDARNQAESIAKINKLKVGKLLSLTNLSTPAMMYKGAVGMTEGRGDSSAATTPSYGEKTMEISASYNVMYELY